MKKNKKYFFIQDWGTYSNETLVCIGMTHNEIVGAMRQIKAKVKITESFIKSQWRFESFGTLDKVWHDAETGATLLSLKDWKDDWKHFDALLHETAHLVHQILGHQRNMMDEDEARAYCHEYLFRELRRKLQNKKQWQTLQDRFAKIWGGERKE